MLAFLSNTFSSYFYIYVVVFLHVFLFSPLFINAYCIFIPFFLFSGHAIFVNSAPGLDATTTPSYALTITCADNYGASQGTLTVNVVANAAPDITNLPASTTVQESAAGGSSIFTVTVADPDSDTFSCTMTSSPASTAFSLLYTTSSRYLQNCSSMGKFGLACKPEFSLTAADLLLHK